MSFTMVSKTLVPMLNRIVNSVKSYNKRTLFYSLFAVFLFLFTLQVIANNDIDFSKAEKEYRKSYNLMERPEGIGKECNLDYINKNKLAQDHPCVIKLIRHMYMNPPSPRDVPYNLTKIIDSDRNESDTEALHILKNKQGGFFVECGAFDGLFLSNTIGMEMNNNWTGLLIEGSPKNYKKLLARNRKSWTSNVCLSLHTYPTKISFTTVEHENALAHAVFRVIEKDEKGNNIYDHQADKNFGIPTMKTIEIQCFPFYSILLASNHTTVDYFSLDIEGHEKRVLETIPWKKVDIKTMRIETVHIPSEKDNKTGSMAVKEFLEGEPGYLNFKILPQGDEFYIKNNF